MNLNETLDYDKQRRCRLADMLLDYLDDDKVKPESCMRN